MALRYENLKRIASSRTSTVYSAESTPDGAVVVVKEYNRFGRDGGVCETEKWAYRSANEGDGPGKSAFLTAFLTGDLCRPDRLVLPKKDGTLADLLDTTGPSVLYLPDVLSISEQLLAGIEYLHRLSIAHTDIKPDNIVLENMERTRIVGGTSESEIIKASTFSHGNELLQCTKIFVIDLGGAAPTGRGCIGAAGTARYRAPEVTLGLPWDGAVDWFAAGCVVFEIATGRSLFPPTTSRRARLAAVVAILGPIPHWMGRRIRRWGPAPADEDLTGSFRIRCTRRNVREAVEHELISRLRPLETLLEYGFVYAVCSNLLQVNPRDRTVAVYTVIRDGNFV